MTPTLDLPYTLLTVRQPCRLSFLGKLGLAPGVYAYPSDLRPKLTSYADRNLEAIGIIKLTFVESNIPTVQAEQVEEAPPAAQIINEMEMQAPESGDALVKTVGPVSTSEIESTTNADYEEVVILDDPIPGRKARRKAKSIALPLTRDKLDNHDQNSIDSTSGVSAPDEDSINTENSGEALA